MVLLHALCLQICGMNIDANSRVSFFCDTKRVQLGINTAGHTFCIWLKSII